MEDRLVMDILRDTFPGCGPTVKDTDTFHEIWVKVTEPFYSEALDRLTAMRTLAGYSMYLAPSDGHIALALFKIR